MMIIIKLFIFRRMNTVEEEERQPSFVSEVSINSKTSAVKVFHTDLVTKDSEDVPGSRETYIHSSSHELRNAVKLNSVIGTKPLTGKFLNHNGDDRDAEDNEELIKSAAVDDDSVSKQGSTIDLHEKETAEEQNIVKPTQVILTPETLALLSKEELVEKWNQQDVYINSLHSTLESTLQEGK